jgi:DNA-directed RNA polymerase specialized sigma24 family protein
MPAGHRTAAVLRLSKVVGDRDDIVVAPDRRELRGRAPQAVSRRAVSAEIAALPRRHAALLRMHYGLGATPQPLAKVAETLGISPRAARQLHAAALERLRWLARTAPSRPVGRQAATPRRITARRADDGEIRSMMLRRTAPRQREGA